jgi:hypothetical protein
MAASNSNRAAGARGKARTTRASSGAARRSGSTQRKGRASSGSSSSSASRGSGRTKEQLYNQAKRLKIEGRSSMTKAQLERAISRKAFVREASRARRGASAPPSRGYNSAR